MAIGLYSAGIIGTGSYLPEKIITNKDLEQIVDTSNEWIVKRTGIREEELQRIVRPHRSGYQCRFTDAN